MSAKKRLDKLEKFFAKFAGICLQCGRIKGEMALGYFPYDGEHPTDGVEAICQHCDAYPEICFYDYYNRGKLEQALRRTLVVTPETEKEFREEYSFLYFGEMKSTVNETLPATIDDADLDCPAAGLTQTSDIVSGTMNSGALPE